MVHETITFSSILMIMSDHASGNLQHPAWGIAATKSAITWNNMHKVDDVMNVTLKTKISNSWHLYLLQKIAFPLNKASMSDRKNFGIQDIWKSLLLSKKTDHSQNDSTI